MGKSSCNFGGTAGEAREGRMWGGRRGAQAYGPSGITRLLSGTCPAAAPQSRDKGLLGSTVVQTSVNMGGS